MSHGRTVRTRILYVVLAIAGLLFGAVALLTALQPTVERNRLDDLSGFQFVPDSAKNLVPHDVEAVTIRYPTHGTTILVKSSIKRAVTVEEFMAKLGATYGRNFFSAEDRDSFRRYFPSYDFGDFSDFEMFLLRDNKTATGNVWYAYSKLRGVLLIEIRK